MQGISRCLTSISGADVSQTVYGLKTATVGQWQEKVARCVAFEAASEPLPLLGMDAACKK